MISFPFSPTSQIRSSSHFTLLLRLNDFYSKIMSRDLLGTTCCHAAEKNSSSSCFWPDFSAGNFHRCRLNISHHLSQGSRVSPLSLSLTRVCHANIPASLVCMQTLSFQHVFRCFFWGFAKSHLCSLSFCALAGSGRSWRCFFPWRLRETLKYVIQRGQPWWRVFCILSSVTQQQIQAFCVETHRVMSHLLHLCVLLHFTVIEGLVWSCVTNENVLLHTIPSSFTHPKVLPIDIYSETAGKGIYSGVNMNTVMKLRGRLFTAALKVLWCLYHHVRYQISSVIYCRETL